MGLESVLVEILIEMGVMVVEVVSSKVKGRKIICVYRSSSKLNEINI